MVRVADAPQPYTSPAHASSMRRFTLLGSAPRSSSTGSPFLSRLPTSTMSVGRVARIKCGISKPLERDPLAAGWLLLALRSPLRTTRRYHRTQNGSGILKSRAAAQPTVADCRMICRAHDVR
jgi:hypothetical protein